MTVKRRLREAPLSQPERVFAGQQPIAKAIPQPLVERTFVVVARVVLKDVFDVCGVRDEESVIRASLEMNDVAVLIRRVEECSDWIGSKLRQDTEDRIAAWSGRIRT